MVASPAQDVSKETTKTHKHSSNRKIDIVSRCPNNLADMSTNYELLKHK